MAVRRTAWLLLGILLLAGLGLWLRIVHISLKPLWLDEAYSAFAAAHDLRFLWTVVPQYETHPPVYYSMLHGWTLLAGDSLIALRSFGVIGGMLALGAIKIGKDAFDALMDRRADPKVIEGISAIARDWPGLYGFHDLKTRTAGIRVFVYLHIELDGNQSLHDAHAIGAALRRAILNAYPQTDVIIHKDVAQSD